jgi:hypothetical protein
VEVYLYWEDRRQTGSNSIAIAKSRMYNQSFRGMATIRHKPGHIAASDPDRTSYKPAFFGQRAYRGEVWTTVHSIQVIEIERRIEMRVEKVCSVLARQK